VNDDRKRTRVDYETTEVEETFWVCPSCSHEYEGEDMVQVELRGESKTHTDVVCETCSDNIWGWTPGKSLAHLAVDAIEDYSFTSVLKRLGIKLAPAAFGLFITVAMFAVVMTAVEPIVESALMANETTGELPLGGPNSTTESSGSDSQTTVLAPLILLAGTMIAMLRWMEVK